jgi:pimeloyl-ACP methyl ester carboxylesterase
MHTTTSRDGTTIAYDNEGDGDPLVLVPGAFSYRRHPGLVKLAGLLAARFTSTAATAGAAATAATPSRMPSSARSRISPR